MGRGLNLSGLMERGGIADVSDYCQLKKIGEHCATAAAELSRRIGAPSRPQRAERPA